LAASNGDDFQMRSWASIKVPFLILVGDHDLVGAEYAVESFRLIPNAELAVIPNDSHFAPFSETEKVISIVKHFMEVPYVSLDRKCLGATAG
jgi:pimeloyl-ACP methyl ester carboxylesterase